MRRQSGAIKAFSPSVHNKLTAPTVATDKLPVSTGAVADRGELWQAAGAVGVHAGKPTYTPGPRPGVDGTYRIANAEHYYSRQGYITTMDIFGEPVDPAGTPGTATPSNSIDQGVDQFA
jgi:hypothetical protein